jgi:Thiol-disulfide isomerase and thioredoxins
MALKRLSLLTILCLLLASCGWLQASKRGVTEGKQLPDATFISMSGQTFSLEGLLGQPLIINFWATWCAPCREEMPLLEAAEKQLKRTGLQVVAITSETSDVVYPYLVENDLGLQVLLDRDGKAAKDYQIQYLPTTFFIDSTGKIIARHTGQLYGETLSNYLEQLVGEGLEELPVLETQYPLPPWHPQVPATPSPTRVRLQS